MKSEMHEKVIEDQQLLIENLRVALDKHCVALDMANAFLGPLDAVVAHYLSDDGVSDEQAINEVIKLQHGPERQHFNRSALEAGAGRTRVKHIGVVHPVGEFQQLYARYTHAWAFLCRLAEIRKDDGSYHEAAMKKLVDDAAGALASDGDPLPGPPITRDQYEEITRVHERALLEVRKLLREDEIAYEGKKRPRPALGARRTDFGVSLKELVELALQED